MIPSRNSQTKTFAISNMNPESLFKCWLERIAGAMCFLMLSVHAGAAEYGWPNRFGPLNNGHVPAEEADGIPVTWDETTGENVIWKKELQEHGHATPVILDGMVWLTSATEDGKRQYVDCFDASSGEQLHHKLVFENEEPEPLGNDTNTYASPTSVVTSDAIYVHFGSYGTARLNPKSLDVVWQRRDIECRHFRGPGSSPVLHNNLLILTFDGIDVQFVMALDAATGDTVWRTDRTTNYGDLDEDGKPLRDGDLRKAYSTPGIMDIGGRTQVISCGANAAFGYDLKTGREIWTIRHPGRNAAAPPAFFGDLAILNTGASGSTLVGIQLNESTRGDVTDTHIAWNRDKANSRMASPVLYDGRVFMVTHAGIGVCIDAASGEELNKIRLGGTFIASPIVVNGLVYAANDDGAVFVMRADASMEIVAKNKLTEGMRASLAAAGGRLYLRTSKHLYCLGTDR
jgi:outer membrane protein assembly factor BamB